MDAQWKNKKILITGAGGFIGSHLVEKMVMEGADVRAFVRYNSRGDHGLLKYASSELISQVEIIEGDLKDPFAVRQAVSGCQVVFHLGAMISIPYSYVHPFEVIETNVLGTLNVLMACRDLQVERVVHTSTSEVYGTARYAPIDEGHPLQAQSPYSASKIAADKLVESFICAYGLNATTIRPFNTYGPRQSSRAVIPTIITQALTQPVIHLGNLETTRDFTFVEDTVRGFILAAKEHGAEGKVINLGTGTEIKIGDLAKEIIRLTDSKAVIEVDSNRLRPKDSEVFRLISNNSLAAEAMSWRPEVTLENGLKKTINWIVNNLSYYRIGTYMI